MKLFGDCIAAAVVGVAGFGLGIVAPEDFLLHFLGLAAAAGVVITLWRARKASIKEKK